MGQCAGKGLDPAVADAVSRQKKIDKVMSQKVKTKKAEDSEIKKLLLLGTGESGKSTLFKQILTNYGTGISDAERKGYVSAIHQMITSTMATFQTQASILGSEVKADVDDSFLENLSTFKDAGELNSEKAKLVAELWAHPFVKELYGLRFGKYYLLDSAEYFLDKVTEVVDPKYLPSDADLIRIRAPTTGIHQTEFQVQGCKMLLVDVGGQRNERKKWLHCFDEVTSVLFVVSLSEYDQVLYEDDTVNRLIETMSTFETIINGSSLSGVAVILLLNKRDLFEEKIKKVPLTYALPSYDGEPGDFDDAVRYIEAEFKKLNMNKKRQMYTHVTCATDTDLVKKLFKSIRETVIKISLAKADLY